MRSGIAVTLSVACAIAAACAPRVDGPVEKQRLADAQDAALLTAQLLALPGVVRAEVVLRRAVADPLAPVMPLAASPPPASPTVPHAAATTVSLVVIIDDRANRANTVRTAQALASAMVPGSEPTIVVEVGAIRPRLAQVGPFTVEQRSKPALQATLVIVLALVAALAGWLAYRQRPRHA